MFTRDKTRKTKIGKIIIGGGNPVWVQAMTQTKTQNIKETVEQINKLTEAGCEIIRVAVPNTEAAQALGAIKKQITIPLVADIHFQYELVLEAVKQGVDKIRINPGNIGGEDRVKMIVNACKKKNIPIRIGINMGSLEKDLWEKYGKYGVSRVMLESATRHIKILGKMEFNDIVVSLKGSDVNVTREAHLLFAKRYDYPLHVGVTEAGPTLSGIVKSSVGIGLILAEGIGDTIRVSVSDTPEQQVKIAWEILKSLGLRQRGVQIVSCPTCGRTEIDLIDLAKKVEEMTREIKQPLKIAVMGCIVNGPGEASFADIGLCGGKGQAVIIKKGKIIKTVPEKEALTELMREIHKIND